MLTVSDKSMCETSSILAAGGPTSSDNHAPDAGIGKSLFLYYFMHLLASTGQTVVLQRKLYSTVVFTNEGAFEGHEVGSLTGFLHFLKDPECW